MGEKVKLLLCKKHYKPVQRGNGMRTAIYTSHFVGTTRGIFAVLWYL